MTTCNLRALSPESEKRELTKSKILDSIKNILRMTNYNQTILANIINSNINIYQKNNDIIIYAALVFIKTFLSPFDTESSYHLRYLKPNLNYKSDSCNILCEIQGIFCDNNQEVDNENIITPYNDFFELKSVTSSITSITETFLENIGIMPDIPSWLNGIELNNPEPLEEHIPQELSQEEIELINNIDDLRSSSIVERQPMPELPLVYPEPQECCGCCVIM